MCAKFQLNQSMRSQVEAVFVFVQTQLKMKKKLNLSSKNAYRSIAGPFHIALLKRLKPFNRAVTMY